MTDTIKMAIGYGLQTVNGITTVFPYYDQADVVGGENFWSDAAQAQGVADKLNAGEGYELRDYGPELDKPLTNSLGGNLVLTNDPTEVMPGADKGMSFSTPEVGGKVTLFQRPAEVEPEQDETEKWCRSLKEDDIIAVLIKGHLVPRRTRVVKIHTHEYNKQAGPFVIVEGGLPFTMKGVAARPGEDVMLPEHHKDIRIAPWTDEMETAQWRANVLAMFKDHNWGRYDLDILRQIIAATASERSALVVALRQVDFSLLGIEQLKTVEQLVLAGNGIHA
jgi:hypothetical protein